MADTVAAVRRKPADRETGRKAPNVSPVRRSHEWAVVGGLALLALILGYVGLRQVYEAKGYSPTELLYRSLQLFVLEGGAVEDEPVPLSLEIARILAPAVAAYAAIRAVIGLFREQLQLLGLRFLLRGHVVVAGLGTKGSRLARAFRSQGQRVVGIEVDGTSATVGAARRHGVHVLVGDAADPAVLGEARASRARYLVVTAANDRRNVDIAVTAAASVGPRRRGALTVFVHLDDLSLWRRLQARILAEPGRPSVRLEFVNVHQAAARTLVERHPPFGADRISGGPVLVVGTGALARSVVVAVARAWRQERTSAERLWVTLAGLDAPDCRTHLVTAHHALEQLCQLEAWRVDPGQLDAELLATRPETASFGAAYVCEDDEAVGLAAALALSDRTDPGGPVVLAVEDETEGVGRALGPYVATGRLELFGVLRSTLTPALLKHGTNEILAQAKHAHYLECERVRGATDGNASYVSWERLDENLKESNRLFADSIGRKLATAGCTIVPVPLADHDVSFTFSEEEVEELARAEHDRWCDDLRREGWRWGRWKDSSRREHPGLVPWSELSEDERDKDREPVRELPRMLTLVGFEIQRMPPAERASLPKPDGREPAREHEPSAPDL